MANTNQTGAGCGIVIGDGFGTNPIVTDNGDGSITLSNDEGDSLIIDICAALNTGTCDFLNIVDNLDGTITINGEVIDVCKAIEDGGCAGGGGGGTSFGSFNITWHHDATTPFDGPFDYDLTAERLGSSDFPDNFFHPYFGPEGPVCLFVLYSNNSGNPVELKIQEIIDADFNTDFSGAPSTNDIGSAILDPNTNGSVIIPINPAAGNGVVESSLLYYYADADANNVRILGVKVTNCS